MPGSLLDADAVIGCPHGGRVTAAGTPSGGVRAGGAVIATAAHSHVVTGCPHTVDGAPVLLDTSAAQCFTAAFVPQGPPVVQAAQRKVTVR